MNGGLIMKSEKSENWYYVQDTQDDSNSYWIDGKGNVVSKRDLLLMKWDDIANKAHKNVTRKRVLLG